MRSATSARSSPACMHAAPCTARAPHVLLRANPGRRYGVVGAVTAASSVSSSSGYTPTNDTPGASPLAPAVGLLLQVAGQQQLQAWPPALLLQWARACAATGYRVPPTSAPALLQALSDAAPSVTPRGALQLLAALDTIALHTQLQQQQTSPSSNTANTAASSSNSSPLGSTEDAPATAAATDQELLLGGWLRLLQSLYVNSMSIGQTVNARGVDRSTALDLAAGMEGAARMAAAASEAGTATAVAAAAQAAQLLVNPSSRPSSAMDSTTSVDMDSLVAQPAAGLPFLGPSAAPAAVVVESWCAALAAGDSAGLRHLPPQQLASVATSLAQLLQLQRPGSSLQVALQWVGGSSSSEGGSGGLGGSSSNEMSLPVGFLASYCKVLAEQLPYLPADACEQLANALPQLLQRYERSSSSSSKGGGAAAGLYSSGLPLGPAAGLLAAVADTQSSNDASSAATTSTSSSSSTDPGAFTSASQEAVAARQLLVDALQRHLPSLSSLQLCELLPLVRDADLALPSDWVTTVTQRLGAGLATLTCGGATRALLALLALQAPPPEPWRTQYVSLLRTGFLELTPEQLVAAMRGLSSMGALPGQDWLEEIADSVQRRWGFIGPVELVRSGFVLANLGHTVTGAWGDKFLSETLRFAEYYGGEEVTHVVWCVVRLRLQPSAAWLAAYSQQLQRQVGGFLPYQLAFTLGSLQQLGASLSSGAIDDALGAFARQLGAATPADAVLMLVTVARLRHICSYSWMQEVLDYLQPRLGQLNGQEAVTLVWSLAQLHHTAEEGFMEQLVLVAGQQLVTMTPTQATELLYSVALLDITPPEAWLSRWCQVFQAALKAGAATGRDVASALSALAALGHTPSDAWLQDALQLLHFKLRDLDAAGLASVPRSLVKLNVTLLAGPWLENFTSMLLPALPRLTGAEKADLITCYATWGAALPPAWLAAFQLSCIAAAEAGQMTPLELEQVVVAVCSLGASPSAALLQLWYDSSAAGLEGWAPERLVNILAALRKAQVLPGTSWLQRVVAQVQAGLQGYSLAQLNSLLQSFMAFQAAGAQQPPLTNLVSYLKEFFLYG